MKLGAPFARSRQRWCDRVLREVTGSNPAGPLRIMVEMADTLAHVPHRLRLMRGFACSEPVPRLRTPAARWAFLLRASAYRATIYRKSSRICSSAVDCVPMVVVPFVVPAQEMGTGQRGTLGK